MIIIVILGTRVLSLFFFILWDPFEPSILISFHLLMSCSFIWCSCIQTHCYPSVLFLSREQTDMTMMFSSSWTWLVIHFKLFLISSFILLERDLVLSSPLLRSRPPFTQHESSYSSLLILSWSSPFFSDVTTWKRSIKNSDSIQESEENGRMRGDSQQNVTD